MKLFKYSGIFLTVLFSLCTAANGSAQSSEFEKALKTAKKQDKRVIVDVYTDWCGWCKKMDADVYAKKKIKEIIEDDFVFVKLNAEGSSKINYRGTAYSETDLASLFQVTGYPTTVFLEPDGKVIEYKYDNVKMNNLPGYFKLSDFRKILEYISDGSYSDTDLSTIVK
jgi:thioredoxin-related protein